MKITQVQKNKTFVFICRSCSLSSLSSCLQKHVIDCENVIFIRWSGLWVNDENNQIVCTFSKLCARCWDSNVSWRDLFNSSSKLAFLPRSTDISSLMLQNFNCYKIERTERKMEKRGKGERRSETSSWNLVINLYGHLFTIREKSFFI